VELEKKKGVKEPGEVKRVSLDDLLHFEFLDVVFEFAECGGGETFDRDLNFFSARSALVEDVRKAAVDDLNDAAEIFGVECVDMSAKSAFLFVGHFRAIMRRGVIEASDFFWEVCL